MNLWSPLQTTSLIIVLLAVAAVFIFLRIWKNKSRIRNVVGNLLLSVFSILFILLFLEIIFGVFMVQSDGYGFTLSSKLWHEKYWKPVNAYGYRDYEHDWKENILFVVGDSFVAGDGIENIDDRSAGVLAKKLGDEWTVAAIAKRGWSTDSEYEALVKHEKRPQKIILSYYINDIENAAMANGLARPQLIEKPNKIIRPIVDNSFLFNWLYWRLYRGGFGDVYWNYLKRAYSDPDVWNSHKKELRNIIDFARQNDVEIVSVVWPHLNHIEGSSEFTSRVVEFFVEEEIKVIDLTTHFRNRASETFVVNALNGHPNKKAHMEAAELVYELLFMRN